MNGTLPNVTDFEDIKLISLKNSIEYILCVITIYLVL